MGIGMTLLGGLRQPVSGLIKIFLGPFAKIVGKAQIVLRGNIARLCRSLSPVHRLSIILTESPALPVGHPQVKHRGRVL